MRQLLITLCFFCLFYASLAAADLAVTNVVASQRADGTGLVDVYYNLSGAQGPVIVELVFSNDNGTNWNVLPFPSLLSGDVGTGVANGSNKHIVWDAARDRADVFWPQARARVTASELGITTTITLPNGTFMEFVNIPAGTFQMGSHVDMEYTTPDSERPVHNVTIAYDFQLGMFEVTQAQWFAVMNGFPQSQPTADANRPVVYVSWNDAQSFISKLNILGLGTFRLPSEAEWEYACRAGSQTRWHFGDDPANLGDYAWYTDNNSPSGVKPVGQKLPNPFGLYDMHGNVLEWCQDWYHDNYGGAPTNGSAWEDPVGSSRVLRGGICYSSASNCRSAARYLNSPGNRLDSFGLRLLRTP